MDAGRVQQEDAGAADLPPAAEVVVGVVGRTFGRRGEVFVEPRNGAPDRFDGIRSVRVGRPGSGATIRREIRSARILRGRPVLGLEGVEDIGTAESLRGYELRIAESERASLPEGVFYFDELIGCRAESPAGATIGEVAGVEEAGGGILLVVRLAGGGGDALVPFVERICPVVDPAARRIVMDPPDGLLEVNG